MAEASDLVGIPILDNDLYPHMKVKKFEMLIVL